MNDLIKKAEKVLTAKELNYFRVMAGQYQVLFLKGRPGVAKSAILRSIASKLDMVFIDLRLPSKDETDMGTFPVITYEDYTNDRGETVKIPVMNHAIPDWAWMTKDTSKYFMIAFEELNRAPQGILDSSLGVLLERVIGHNFKFKWNVFMAATGNLGQADGTTVNELDTATKGRLVTFVHDTDAVTWITDYAEANVHPDIVKFITAHADMYYPDLKENEQNDVITSGRSWDGLSKAIIANFGKDSTVDDYGGWVKKMGKGYVGSRALRFIEYMEDNKRFTLTDVKTGKIKDYSKVNRDNMAEITKDLVAEGVADLTKKQFDNVVKFTKALDPDVRTGVLFDMSTTVLSKAENIKDWSENDRVWAKLFYEELTLIYKTQDTK